jgi:hypothetical protein
VEYWHLNEIAMGVLVFGLRVFTVDEEMRKIDVR